MGIRTIVTVCGSTRGTFLSDNAEVGENAWNHSGRPSEFVCKRRTTGGEEAEPYGLHESTLDQLYLLKSHFGNKKEKALHCITRLGE